MPRTSEPGPGQYAVVGTDRHCDPLALTDRSVTHTDRVSPAQSIRAAGGARRGRPGYDVESLLAVSAEEFTRKGFDGTSMEDLARRLGITKSAIYHHVPSKGELLRIALDRALDGLFAVTAEPEASAGPAIARLEHVVRGSVRVLATELPYVTLLLRVRGNSAGERAPLSRRREFDRFVTGLVTDAVAQGSVRSDIDPSVIARLLFGAVNSLTEWYRPEGGLSTVRLADALVHTVFDGLGPD